MKLAMGVNDLSRFGERGVNVAIGTDGPASNADLDMPAAIRQTVILQKHEQRNPQAVPGDLALRMATRNGARAIGFAESGVLAPGNAADLVLVDLDKPHMLPRHDLVANLVHALKASDVVGVMADGRWLYRNGEILTLDEEKIKAEAEKGAFKLVGREMWSLREYRA
jgi:5-methylthioadenosine/S-adenosylhomocysteine deaminase